MTKYLTIVALIIVITIMAYDSDCTEKDLGKRDDEIIFLKASIQSLENTLNSQRDRILVLQREGE